MLPGLSGPREQQPRFRPFTAVLCGLLILSLAVWALSGHNAKSTDFVDKTANEGHIKKQDKIDYDELINQIPLRKPGKKGMLTGHNMNASQLTG